MNIEIPAAGTLAKPTCPNCGFQVENDCVVGAGCPNCHQRLYPPAAPNPAAELQAKDAELGLLRARVAELEEAATKKGKK